MDRKYVKTDAAKKKVDKKLNTVLKDFGFNPSKPKPKPKPKVTPKPKPKSPDTGSMNGKQYDAHLRKIIAEMKKTQR